MKLIEKVISRIFRSKFSYSQCGEDMILAHIFRILKIDKPKYLDIGTNHPYISNNTILFYKLGSDGVCVEPNPTLHALIQSKRKRDVCLNIGVGEASQNSLDFFVMNPDTLSTFSKQDAEDLEKVPGYSIKEVVKVPVLSINEILQKQFLETDIDLVSIDVEGLNEAIIDSLDLKKFRPKVFCIETLTFSSNNQNKKIQPILDKLIAHNYFVYADTFLNTIFIDINVWQ